MKKWKKFSFLHVLNFFPKISKSFSNFLFLSVTISIFDKACWINSRSTFFFESAFWRLPFPSSMISSTTFRLDLHLTISASNKSLALVASTYFLKSPFFLFLSASWALIKAFFLFFSLLHTYSRKFLLPWSIPYQC